MRSGGQDGVMEHSSRGAACTCVSTSAFTLHETGQLHREKLPRREVGNKSALPFQRMALAAGWRSDHRGQGVKAGRPSKGHSVVQAGGITAQHVNSSIVSMEE